jgi:hypothetical protein
MKLERIDASCAEVVSLRPSIAGFECVTASAPAPKEPPCNSERGTPAYVEWISSKKSLRPSCTRIVRPPRTQPHLPHPRRRQPPSKTGTAHSRSMRRDPTPCGVGSRSPFSAHPQGEPGKGLTIHKDRNQANASWRSRNTAYWVYRYPVSGSPKPTDPRNPLVPKAVPNQEKAEPRRPGRGDASGLLDDKPLIRTRRRGDAPGFPFLERQLG